MMVAHGLCSSGLFAFCMFRYQWSQSRSLLVSKGLLRVAPMLSLWWFLLRVVNMAAPPSLNLVREIILIGSIVFYSLWLFVPVFFIRFLAAAYSLYLYTGSQHGSYPDYMCGYSGGCFLPSLVGFLHWVPVNVLVLLVDDF